MQGEPERLDSWKQIAAYLGRSERTVRRWQETEGLPVHRHLHQQRGSVWAYRSELDAWLESHRTVPVSVDETPARRERPWRVRVVIAVAVLTVITVTFLLARKDPPLAIPEPVQITALPGAIYGPSFSPDGSQLVFHWSPLEGRSGVFVKSLGEENVSPLVTSKEGGQFDYSPAWSPDGKTIAFIRRIIPESGFVMYATASETWLYLIASGGGPERRLIRLAKDVIFYANSSHLSWSPDSQWIFAPIAVGDRNGIHRISVHTGEAVRITKGREKEFAPALSSDGRVLVYMRQEGPPVASVERVIRQDLEGGSPTGEPRELFTGRSMSSGLAWLPSGKELIFCSADQAFYGPFNSRIFKLSAEQAAAPVPIGFGSGCSTVAVSRAGASGRATLVYATGENAKGRLYQARLDDFNDSAPLAPSSRFDALPRHSPDGSLIAFVSNRTGHAELWLTKPDGSGTTRLTENSHITSTPDWSPDGNRLVYGSGALPTERAGATYSIFIVAVSGGEPVRVPVTQSWPSDPSWSHDGSEIYYWSGSELWRTRPDGSHASKVGEYPAHFVRPNVQGGDHVYYARPSKPFAVWRTTLNNSKQEMLADGLLTPFFAVTKKFAYYIQQSDSVLCARPLAGGPVRRIGPVRELTGMRRIVLGISVSPDDETVVFAVTGDQQLDLQLVRDFR
jgi:Tol biopolymer transport system component